MIAQARSAPCASNTITSALSACGKLRDLALGRQVHAYAVKIGMLADDDAFIGAALVDMYGKCSCMGLAMKAFCFLRAKSVVAWSSLVANYVQNNDYFAALQAFREMTLANSEVPNAVTLTTLITACARIPSLLHGKELHSAVIRRRPSEPDVFVSTALVSMYCKCGSLAYACRVMESDGRVLGSNLTPMWNAMIAEHVANDRVNDALSMIRLMGGALRNRVALNSVTMATVLPICGKSVSLLHGKELHCYAVKFGLGRETVVGNGILEMYCKCGKINLAQHLFDRMPEKSVVSWTTMIDGYGKQGNGHSAIRVFERMVDERNVDPDHITFVALVSACSHSGLMEEGLKYSEMMTREYGIIPAKENYGCLVDLLARSGNIDEAMNIIKMMPLRPGTNIWGTLLGACRIHGNVDEAEYAMQHLLEPQPKGSGFQTLLAKVYAEMGRLDSAIKVQKKKVETGVASRQGCSWLAAEGEYGYG